MRETLQMLTLAREGNTQVIPAASVATTLEPAFPKPAEDNTMIGVVDAIGSPLTEAVTECLYGPHSRGQPQPVSALLGEVVMTEEEIVEDEILGEEEENPFGPLNFDGNSLTESILDDIMDGDDGEFFVGIEMVGLLPPELWGNKDQPKALEGDVFAEEAEWDALTDVIP